jgi:hypothetical protein
VRVRLLELIDRLSNWRGIAILVVLCLACFFGFGVRLEKLLVHSVGSDVDQNKIDQNKIDQNKIDQNKILVEQNKILDARFWYTPADARTFFKNLKAAGRKTYAISELTLDLVFLATYGLLFAVFIRHLYPPRLAWLVVLPLAASVFDLLENITLVSLAWTYSGDESPAAGFAVICTLAAICTVAKSVFYAASVLLVFAGALRRSAGASSPV